MTTTSTASDTRMSVVGIVTIAFGLLVVCTRGPLAVAPAATLRRFRGLIATNRPTRILGAVVLILGAAMVWAGTTEDSSFASLLMVVGLWIGAAGALLVILPGGYRGLVRFFLPDVAKGRLLGWRLLGVLGTSIGLLVIYIGVRAL